MTGRSREVGTITAGILGAAMLGTLALPAHAENKLEFSANVALTTDYVFRGVSQTLSDPALQGGFDASWGIFYIGTWASNVDFGLGDPADLEIDYYGGIKPTWKNITFDLGAIFYTYPSVGVNGYDVVEGKVGVSTTIWQNFGIGATAYLADRHYQVYEFATGYQFTNKWWIFTPSVSGTVGFLETDGSFQPLDYTYWNAGLTLGFLNNWSADVRYWDSDISATQCVDSFGFGRKDCDARVVGTIKAAF